MNDIICTSCNIEIPKIQNVTIFKDAESGLELNLKEIAEHLKKPRDGVIELVEEQEVLVATAKVFDGTVDQAETEGWQQNEFGWVCPPCCGTEYKSEDSSCGFENTNELIQAAVKMKVV